MINIKTRQEIAGLRAAAKIVAETFKEIEDLMHPGTVLIDIDQKAEKYILKQGGEALYKGHQAATTPAAFSWSNLYLFK